MKFYIMRHAHAEEGDRMDGSRELTKYGKWQAKVMQHFVKHAGCKMDLVLTSDFERGVQTGDCFRPKKARHVVLKELRPSEFTCDAQASAEKAWAKILATVQPDEEHVLVVGHGPQIHELVRAACFFFEPGEKILAHGNMVKIQTSEEHQFHWLMTPKLAAKLLGIKDKTDSEDGHNDEMAEQGKDPEALAIDEADLKAAVKELEFSLQENLGKPDRRSVVDPLVSQLQKALRIRWATQLRQLEDKGLPMLQESLLHVSTLRPNGMPAPDFDKRAALAVLPLRSSGFANKFHKVTAAAYGHGADRVAGQLPVTATEAKPTKRPNLPGPSREPDDVEDSLDETTTERVGSLIEKAFQTPLPYAAMVGLIRDEFRSWGNAAEGETSRAETVALNEVSTAYHDGGKDYAADWKSENGRLEKRWNAEEDACDVCLENEAEGFIDSDAPHSSGDDEPPAHPNCQCEEEYQAVAVEEALR